MKYSFEEKLDVIDGLIEKHRYSWTLHAIAWFDYEDVAQDIRLHIFQKWDQWDQARPLEPWLNQVIRNRIINKLRDHYMNCVKPCVGCKMREGETGCLYTPSKTQCRECPLYANWEKSKKYAYNVKLPVSIEHHGQELENMPHDSIELHKYYAIINQKVHLYLTRTELEIYRMLYIDNKTEEDVALKLGLKTTEKKRKAGYRQIVNYKNSIREKIKKMLLKEDIL